MAAMPREKFTPNQYDAMCAFDKYVGKTVSCLTSQYDANVAERARRESVGTFNSAALRGLEARGYIKIELAYWKGATVTVLKGMDD